MERGSSAHSHQDGDSEPAVGVKLPSITNRKSELHTVATGADTESQDCITETDRQLPSSLIRYATGGETFLLPHRSRLPPGQEQEPSILDAWPKMDVAAASFLRLGAPQGRHVLTGQRYQIPPSEAQLVKGTRPQAHLVALLNKRIETELRRNGISRDACSQRKLLTRLQIYKDAFDILASKFHSYRPLLAEIMAVYEETVQYQDVTIKSLQPLKQAMLAVQRDCERKLLQFQQEENTSIVKLQRRNQELQDIIQQMKYEETTLQAKVDKLSAELGAAYQQYRDEADQRTLLLTELNDMRYRQQDMEKTKGKEEKVDPVLMSMMVNRLKKDLHNAQTKLVETIADYGDVVPRKDFDKLGKTTKKLEKDLKGLRDSHAKLTKEHSALQKAHEDTIKQRNTLGSEYQEVHRSHTPRPDWDKFQEHLLPEDGDWAEIRNCRTSRQMSEAVLAKLDGQPLPELVDGKHGPQAFVAKGTGQTVLKHLRAEGVVRNRHIRHKELLILIQELWSGYRELDEKKKKKTAMPDHLWQYLEHRFAVPSLCSEWAYSIDDACRRYSSDDAHIGLFHAVLNKQMDEEVYDIQLKTFSSLETMFAEKAAEAAAVTAIEAGEAEVEDEKDEEMTSQAKLSDGACVLSITTLSECLQMAFPVKTTASIDALCDCAGDEAVYKAPPKIAGRQDVDDESAEGEEAEEVVQNEEEEPSVDTNKLFVVDETGFTSDFIHLLRDQERRERLDYLSDISNALASEAESEISLDQLKSAILATDPQKETAYVDQTLAYAFATPANKLPAGSTTCLLQTILERLQTRAIQRAGPRPE